MAKLWITLSTGLTVWVTEKSVSAVDWMCETRNTILCFWLGGWIWKMFLLSVLDFFHFFSYWFGFVF